MRILRTFYIPAKNTTMTLPVSESALPDTVVISIGAESIALSQDAFEALCELKYKLEWVFDDKAQEDYNT